MVEKGWARRHATFDDLAQAAGARAVTLNKLGLVSKEKSDGSTKHRFIWDLPRSGVNALVRQGERVVLPRLAD
eukprot:11218130-Lingulodinium_polyedra.AAC.1